VYKLISHGFELSFLKILIKISSIEEKIPNNFLVILKILKLKLTLINIIKTE
jgi:hypothetical protein